MATERGRDDPAGDPAADYDYRGGAVNRPGFVRDLAARIDGEVRFDEYTRQLYATDASIYEVTPVGVVFPQSTADVAATMAYCAERGTPVLPRGAGTSLAGQTVNEAVVLDFTRYMDGLVDVDPDARRARAQPGITLGHLNAALEPHDLKFAPDPAWGDKSTLGGAVGNNSTGAHSLQYGKTDAYVESCEVVLADGTVTTFGEIPLAELRDRADPDGDLQARIYDAVAALVDERGDLIAERYPDLKRNVSGYNLDWVVEAAREDGVVNLASLLAGSEGTLAVVTEVEVSLVEVPATTSLALLAYEDVIDAVSDVAPLIEHDPSAVELVDDVLLDLARERPAFADLVEMLPDGTGAALLVEVYADGERAARGKIADVLADRVPGAEAEGTVTEGATTTDAPTYAFDALEAHDDATQAAFWSLRKSGLPILLSRTTDDKHVSFVEDTAVPPEHLPEYVADFRAILADHDTFASFYAHAGPGVLHVRPLVNTKTVEGVETMRSIAEAVTDLVVEYDGSVSGEHGDGRARTQWNRTLYGEEIWTTFRELKTAFDPDWLLNPGQVVFREDDPTEMTEHHRFGPGYAFDAGFEPTLDWDDDGFQGMAELCHGCGGCRGHQDTTGGVMCPTYRAAEEEILSTRGRANALRAAMSGDLPDGEARSTAFHEEVLDLCIGCKGCKHDCPSGVDLAKLKVELSHERHRREGVPLRDRLFANVGSLAKVASATAPVSNWLTDLPGVDLLAEKALGIARERDLPTYRRRTFAKRVAGREPAVPESAATRRAVLVPDVHTNYGHPEVGEAALAVLEAAGVHVAVADPRDFGRPAFSKGLLDSARERARRTVAALEPRVAEGWDVVVIEPSDAVMVQSDYGDLLSGEAVARLSSNTYGVCEYLDRFGLDAEVDFDAPDERLAYHGHCQQQAIQRDHHAVGVLRRAGYAVDPLDSTCCGMAGSFGYEAEHYSMSMAIGSILFEQVTDADADRVVAPGASCRTQLADRDEAVAEPPAPVEMLARALDG